MNRTLVPGLALLLTIAMGSMTIGGMGPATQLGVDAAVPPADQKPASSLAFGLLREFLALPAEPTKKPDESAAQLRQVLRDRATTLDVLIATLPHPRDSHLDWAFDSQLDSIRRAFERTNYVLDRMHLPWDESATTDQATSKVPGVLLFRRTSGAVEGNPASLWLVYLVTELSSVGVDKDALSSALHERALLVARSTGSLPQVLPIVGPTFSGSSASLRMALERAALDEELGLANCTVRIVSGAATGSSNHALLTRIPHLNSSFETTLHTDALLQKLLNEQVLGRLGIQLSELAILEEGTTEYGQGLESGSFHVPFPMSIASLRTASVDTGQKQGGSFAAPTRAAPTRTKFDLSDVARPRETVAAASELTAPSIDLMLEELSRSLSRRGIKAVLIFATDVRDKLFLGVELKKRLPELQLITTEGNILYLRGEFNHWLRGMLVLSTYPILLRDPEWNPQAADGGELTFANEGAEGVFNAVLVQLGNQAALADFAQPVGDEPPLPVWLTAVGSSSMLPVTAWTSPLTTQISEPLVAAATQPRALPQQRIVGRDDDPALAPHASAPTHGVGGDDSPLAAAAAPRPLPRSELSHGASRGGRFAAVFVTALMSIFLIVLAALERNSSSALPPTTPDDAQWRGLPWARRHQDMEHIALALHHEIYASLVYVSLVCLLLPNVALMQSKDLFQLDELAPARLLGGLACLVALFTISLRARRALQLLRLGTRNGVWHAWRALDWPDPQSRSAWQREIIFRSLSFLVGPAYLGLTLLLCAQIHFASRATPATNFELFFHRAIEIDQGLSPLVPLMLLGLIMTAWCRWHYERIQMLKSTPPARALFERRVRQMDSVWTRLFSAIPDASARWLLLALIVGGALSLSRFKPTWERLALSDLFGVGAFDLSLRLGIVGAVCASVWAVYRLVSVWRAFQAELADLGHQLESLPFPDLKKRFGMAANLRLWPTWTKYDMAAQIAERRRTLSKQPGNEDDEVAALDALLAEIAPRSKSTERIDAAQWKLAARELAAMESLAQVEWVLRHLRRLCLFLLISLVLTTFLVSSYPFHPVELCRIGSLLVFAGVVLVLVAVIGSMNRDPVLSLMAGTGAGEISWDRTLLLNLLMYMLVPVLTLIGAQYPALRALLGDQLRPLLEGVLRL